ncbi:MAG: 30S ribosomal protein S1 [Desulfobulbus sp.]|jgi:small subunit ribosomal protein S1|uniref:30S ribosomal protein S1 n=1 Tax=Desulfobulbus sp. TaxID=895 RepID=UPI00284FDADC|nr:30S ribosomal protein S1 [Desulfobulbus sp.]MDR2551537.1 30S ribosomal protein S1 [Desulfobulbus sp.]
MSNETFAELFQDKAVSRSALQPGSRVEATVVGISGDTVFLDAGGKSEGVLSAAELRDQSGNLSVTPGDRVQVFFLAARGGEMLFTTRLGSGQASSRELEEAFHSGIPVEGKVTGEVKGGFSVTVAGQRGFCPYSQMDIRKVEQAEDYLEKTFAFKVIEFGSQGRNIILSARAVLEEQRQQEREQLKARLQEGMQVKGTVTSIRDFGAFVDIGGVDGLIPIAELAWGQTERVEDVLSRGQQVEVIIKRLDWDSERISLSLRETLENPWDKVTQRYPVGSVHHGRVSRLAAFGAFVTLEPGVDGLLHISKLGAGRRIHHPREVLSGGQELTVKIESIDTAQKRLALTPEDYVAKEQAEDSAPPPPIPRELQSMGTLGDLLQRQMKKKK